jgi:hypothetical protein
MVYNNKYFYNMEKPMTENPKLIISIDEIYDMRDRKRLELEYYTKQLLELQEKMSFIRREIVLTETIIKLVESDKVIDLINSDTFMLPKK